MARTKKINENMGELIEALAEFRSRESSIRAEYARLAEQKIAESHDKVLDLMFIKHADAGPSEIANTTGLSRSTVIRWRAGFLERQAQGLGVEEEDVPEFVETVEKLDASEPTFTYSMERSEESNADVHLIQKDDGQAVYILWGDVFAGGESADEGEVIERPDWLTDEVLSEAENATGVLIPGAIHR